MPTILIVDDHFAVREGTKAILQKVNHFDVVSMSPPFTREGLKGINFSEIDLVLMDMNLGDGYENGMTLAKEILNIYSDMKIVIYTGYNNTDYWGEAVLSGIYGAVNKSEPMENLISYIEMALKGHIVVGFEQYRKTLLKNKELIGMNKISEENESLINEREKQILIELEKGLTNQEIADTLHLSKRSIEYSLTNVYTKLNIGTRTEAVLIAKSKGYID